MVTPVPMSIRALLFLLLLAVSQQANALQFYILSSAKMDPVIELTYSTSLHDRMESHLKPDTCGPVSFDVYLTFESCPGACDWTMEFDAIEGFPPFTYAIEGDSCSEYVTVFMTDALGCTDSAVVFIYSIPDLVPNMLQIIDASNGQSNGSVEINAAGGSPPYMYSLDGINYQSSPFFTELSPGSYCITIQDSQGCTTKTDSFTIENSTSTIEFTPHLKIYPNPADMYIVVESDTPVALDLLDVNGKILKRSANSDEHNVDVVELPRGLYFIRLFDSFGYTFQRIVLQ
jgi:hypothetical protein